MPRQGQSVESCIITEWHKKVGDSVTEGEPLFSYETDKAAFDEEAKAAGTLLAVFFDVDDDVPCLTNVAVVGAPGESFAEFDPRGGEAKAAPAEAAEEKPAETETAAAAPATVTERTEATAVSPRARATAERMKLDASLAAPTGPHGRVIERDIFELARSGRGAVQSAQPEKAAEAKPAADAPEFEDIKLSNIRKVIAKSMFESLQSMAQLTHNSSFDATNIMSFRKQLKKYDEDMPKVTLNDIIIYTASRVLLAHPDLNAHFLGDKIRRFSHVHMGIAVDTPRGLMVPTLFNADTKGLFEIAEEAKALAKACQDGSIDPDKLHGASFTISNLGTFGVESFTPVINPPQTGILGVDCIIERVRKDDGVIYVYPAMGLSLTYDHRAIDGAPASRFLMDMRRSLENFSALLVK